MNNTYRNNYNLEEFYPDTYKVIHPIVVKECSTNTMPITKEIIEKLTDNVYNAVEIDLKIETNTMKKDDKNINSKQPEDRNIRQRNSTLRDLIKILILNELLNNGRYPENNRPPYNPGGSMRPPYPGNKPPFFSTNRQFFVNNSKENV